jgi:site-specific DNA-methyltransferase (adenine-specific)
MNNVWHFGRTSAVEREDAGGHATPKPIALCARAIKSSSREGETVLDVFGGSGSTLIACEQLNRKCRMMELDEHYCDVIRKRWAEFVHGEGCDWHALTPEMVG